MIRHLLEFDVLEEEVRSQIEQVDDYEEKRHEWNKQLLIDDRSVEEKTTLIEELFETNTWTTMQDEWNFDKQDNLPLYDCFSSIARCWTEKTVWWHVPYVYMSYTHTHTWTQHMIRVFVSFEEYERMIWWIGLFVKTEWANLLFESQMKG